MVQSYLCLDGGSTTIISTINKWFLLKRLILVHVHRVKKIDVLEDNIRGKWSHGSGNVRMQSEKLGERFYCRASVVYISPFK